MSAPPGRLLIVADVDMFSNINATYAPLDDNGTFALNGTAFITEVRVVTAMERLGRKVIEAGVMPWLPLLIALGALGRRYGSRS